MRAACLLTALLASCGPSASVGPSVRGRGAVPAGARDGTAVERVVLDLVNGHRASRGLRSLASDASIVREARLHSSAMADGKVPLGHDGFAARMERLRRTTPCRRSAENVAFNEGHASPAAEAVRGWLASPEHRTNIEGPYQATGVGVASSPSGGIYFTQIFVGACTR